MQIPTLSRIGLSSALLLPLIAGQEAGFAAGNSHMKTLGRTSQPIGHYEYCKQYPRDCRIRTNTPKSVRLTRKAWGELVAVNDYSNRAVQPVTDLEFYKREEFWTYPNRYGDCEDYVLLKRKLLMERGWPASSLLVTVVTLPNGDGHAVLTVRTDRADYALDNLNNKILPWNETKYRYLKRQSEYDSGKWVTIEHGNQKSVASVKR